MSATWDSKAVKATPLGADEILLIDTADSRNQKRATLTSLPFSDTPWTVNHNAAGFNLINVSGIGIGVTIITHALEVLGDIELTFTATEADSHALEMICDADGFGDVKALDILFDTGTVGAGENEGAILINIDESAGVGGEIYGLEVLASDITPTITKIGMKVGASVNPISQSSGTFVDTDSILVLAVDQTVALSSGGAGNVSTFVADDDTITIGDAAKFQELEFILDTGASAAGIAPTFEFSTGVGTWAVFTPTDGTNAMRNTGEVIWALADVPSWAVGTGSEFLIRITRTRNTLSTTPITDLIQIAAVTLYTWDKNGSLIVNDITPTTLNSVVIANYALHTENLSVFAATTSAQLAGVISDETGTGLLVFGTSPTIGTPTIQGTLLSLLDDTTSIVELEANHTTPADGQIVGQIDFIDDSDTGVRRTYGEISSEVEDPTNAAEGGSLFLSAISGGTLTNYITMNAGSSDEIALNKNMNASGNNISGVASLAMNSDSLHTLTDSASQFFMSMGTGDDIVFRQVTTELFRINEAEGFVASRRIQGLKGADVASADAITLGDGNYFDITGSTTINHLLTTDWQAGSQVTLQFDSTPTITNAAGGATGDEADFALLGAADWTTVTAGDTLTLIFDGTLWREISRSAN